TPLAEAYELLTDEAMAFERKPNSEEYARFRKATVSSRLASRVPSAAKSRGDASQKLIEHVAGDCPTAWLGELGTHSRAGAGAGAGAAGTNDHQKFMLREECVIGRTSMADICITSDGVSRRHAEVFANAGEYWVADLGSTNATIVNGKQLGRAPHKLRP